MINALKRLWEDPSKQSQQEADVALAITTLMVYVIQQDDHLDDAEHHEVIQSIQQRFHVSLQEAEQYIKQAKHDIQSAHDLHQYTSPLVKTYSQNERVDIIRQLWRVAMADNNIDPYEEALIRKIAELIGVHHHQFIDAKIAARQ